jgi:hypothetical protein
MTASMRGCRTPAVISRHDLLVEPLIRVVVAARVDRRSAKCGNGTGGSKLRARGARFPEVGRAGRRNIPS